jgi:predicted nuclease of restriction endonuclease-like (RecB) superfamily
MKQFIKDIRQILEQARQNAYNATAFAMVEGYWLMGKRIVEEEQAGKERASYGMEILNNLSLELGKGFSYRTLSDYRQFYLTFSNWEDFAHMCAKLNWSHIRLIMRVSDKNAQAWYFKEAAANNWAVRTLERNIGTLYYDRLLLSQIKEPVQAEMIEKTTTFQQDKFEFIKNPSVLEFLNLPANLGYTEAELEKALIDNIQKFILELGKGFAFVERQQLIRTETKDYHIDLIFYNYLLKCFVIIDLKTEPITHQDVGQMDMYVRMYDELKKSNDDNPTLGIVLCTETDHDIARYSILKGNEQIFASKYKLYLPSEEELRAEIEREKLILKLQFAK